MAKPEDGGPAFPNGNYQEDGSQVDGMSLRDWFAGMALQGLLARSGAYITTQEGVASEAYKLAQAMLQERARGR